MNRHDKRFEGQTTDQNKKLMFDSENVLRGNAINLIKSVHLWSNDILHNI